MLERKPLFPNVIELNYQAGSVFGCNVYLIYDEDEWVLIDIGYEEVVNEVVDIIRGLDFPFSKCKALIAPKASGADSLNEIFSGIFAIILFLFNTTYSAKHPAFNELIK